MWINIQLLFKRRRASLRLLGLNEFKMTQVCEGEKDGRQITQEGTTQ